MSRRLSFVPNRILLVTGIVVSGAVLGTSVRADYLTCVNDEGKPAFVNTGSCPEGYSPSGAYPEVNRPPRKNVLTGDSDEVVFVTSNCRGLGALKKATGPQGFSITPAQAFSTVQNARTLPPEHCWEIYAYGRNYYIVDSFLGSSPSTVFKSGVRVDGQTGSILPRSAADPDQHTPTDTGEKLPTIWEIGFGDPAAEEWLRKKLTDKSKWTDEGRSSTPEKVWNHMKAALLRGDIEGAVRCLSPSTRDQYRETFQALGTGARVMAQEMKELIPRGRNDFTAEYWLPRDTEVDGRVRPLVFSVTFIRGGDGVWLIERF